MARSWQAEQERLLRNEQAELDEEMNDSNIASSWVHVQNIESSNKLLARLNEVYVFTNAGIQLRRR